MRVVTNNLVIFIALFVNRNENVLGFAPEIRTRLTTSTKSSKLFGASLPLFTEDEAFYQMQKARECALSDTCSVDDAREYLSDVLHVQGGCVSGTLAGQSLCEGDQSEIAETVALLRQKIDGKAAGVMMVSNNLSMLVNNPFMTSALSIVIFYFSLIILSTIDFNQGAVPFTFQEWYWAIRDGYVSQMMGHYFRYGGLEASDTSLTPQEWFWAMKDGYFGSAMGHYFRNGGLDQSATSLTPQEWYWAMRDGYLGDMMGHYFRNGGLEQSATSFTPEEWYMATKGGYLGDMIQHYYRNGGM